MFIISSPVFIAFVITIKLIVCLFCAVKLRLFSAQDAADWNDCTNAPVYCFFAIQGIAFKVGGEMNSPNMEVSNIDDSMV